MNRKKFFTLIVISVLVLAAIALALTHKQYSVTNPPNVSYFESKYTLTSDAQKCVDEWHKYYPAKNGIEQTLTGIPCPGQAR